MIEFQRKARRGHDPGALVCLRELHPAKHPLFQGFAALVSNVSLEPVAIDVCAADSLVAHGRIAEFAPGFQPDIPGGRRDGVSRSGHQVVKRLDSG